MEFQFLRTFWGTVARRREPLLALALWAHLWTTGCRESTPPALTPAADPTNVPAAAESSLHLDHAQSNLPLVKLWVGAEELTAEVCATPEQLATGMMFRTNLAEDAAMIFAFAAPYRASFYMKNTTLPLSAAYIDPDGVILEIHDLKPFEEKPVEASNDMIQFVLEVNKGWFQRHGISTGTVVRASSGPLRQGLRRR